MQQITHWHQQIDQNTQDFQAAFGHLSSAQLNWKPDPQTWSIAQNLDHLIVINSTYFPLLEKVRKGDYQLPFLARFGFLVKFIGQTILKASQPDRKRKMKTFPVWEPASSEIEGDILARFAAHQAELKREIAASEELLKQGAIIPSPGNQRLFYRLEVAFEIIVTHERRHLMQAKEVLERVG